MANATEASRAIEPTRLRPWHEMVADMLIADPNLSQREIARRLGRSEYWMSIVCNSDAFQDYLARRKEEFIDPILQATVEDRLSAVANRSMDEFLRRMDLAPGSVTNDQLIRATEVSTKSLGMGPQTKAPVMQQNLYVIPAPARPANSKEWVDVVANTPGVIK
jgi:hypothetical protein